MADLLPIFPLELVLFPGTPLPLHIFEERYKEMVAECLEQKRPFGVVRAMAQAVAEVGCTAEIVELAKKYEDGRLDIICEGRQRFEVVRLDEGRSFLRAEVNLIEDEAELSSAEHARSAIECYNELMALVESDADTPELDDPQLSFHLVAPLPVDLDFKQTLLASRSEAKRIAMTAEYLTAVLPRMKRALKAREKAGGNGHGL
jgi:Lon protease-like protein